MDLNLQKMLIVFLVLIAAAAAGGRRSGKRRKTGEDVSPRDFTVVTDGGISGGNGDGSDCDLSTSFQCADNNGCVNKLYECDKIVDCADGSDEHDGCQYFDCGFGDTYVSQTRVCDGVNDCIFGNPPNLDEKDCHICTEGFNLHSKSQVDQSKICDGVYDCLDDINSDECGCNNTFVCDNKRCIHENERCDGKNDCGDDSDELYNCTIPCKINQFACDSGFSQGTRECIPESLHCDGFSDCPEQEDEQDCEYLVCDGGMKHHLSLRCDGFPNCKDRTDECGCGNSSDTFLCSNGKCISSKDVCTGNDACGDCSAEIKCNISGSLEEVYPLFYCDDGSCMREADRCTGTHSCSREENFKNCPTTTTKTITTAGTTGMTTELDKLPLNITTDFVDVAVQTTSYVTKSWYGKDHTKTKQGEGIGSGEEGSATSDAPPAAPDRTTASSSSLKGMINGEVTTQAVSSAEVLHPELNTHGQGEMQVGDVLTTQSNEPPSAISSYTLVFGLLFLSFYLHFVNISF